MRNCFVPLCDSISKHMPKRMMFFPPKEEEPFKRWAAALPKHREFKRHDRVCERHFGKKDIITTFDHVINGSLHQIERGKPRLEQNAVPSLNLTTIDSKLNTRVKRKRTVREISRSKRYTETILHEDGDEEQLESPPLTPQDRFVVVEVEKLPVAVPDETQKNFEMLFDDIYEVTLPSTLWGLHRDPDRQYIVFSHFDVATMAAQKIFHIDNRLNSKLLMRNKVVVRDVLKDVSTGYLSNLLAEIDEYKFCTAHRARCNEIVTQSGHLCYACSQDA